MLFTSPRHQFDTIIVILCVIAGASSQILPDANKEPINPIQTTYKSFIEFILDTSPSVFHQMFRTKPLEGSKDFQDDTPVCTKFSNFFDGNQMKFCENHQDILYNVVPQIMDLTRKECARITNDLKWNCSGIEYLLDRSNPLALTKEAALMRSLINASMMYLVVQVCSDRASRSCGCLSTHAHQSKHQFDDRDIDSAFQNTISKPNGSEWYDLSHLKTGLPVRLSQSIVEKKDCSVNFAFASAFTQVFIDTEDVREMNRALSDINEPHYTKRKFINSRSKAKRLLDSDIKEFAYIKWAKSAINLHNNNIGRLVVREATQRRCRCQGISGMCQIKSCWDQPLDFDIITSRLKHLYMTEIVKVELKNLGSYEEPDLYISRAEQLTFNRAELESSSQLNMELKILFPQPLTKPVQIKSPNVRELVYLYDSPEYCEPQPSMDHPGTKGRTCTNETNSTFPLSDPRHKLITESKINERNLRCQRTDGAPGTCRFLCCNRGYLGELVLNLVDCNCRFRFCCRVECDYCLRQREQYRCL